VGKELQSLKQLLTLLQLRVLLYARLVSHSLQQLHQQGPLSLASTLHFPTSPFLALLLAWPQLCCHSSEGKHHQLILQK
jgi:hypothetical protein